MCQGASGRPLGGRACGVVGPHARDLGASRMFLTVSIVGLTGQSTCPPREAGSTDARLTQWGTFLRSSSRWQPCGPPDDEEPSAKARLTSWVTPTVTMRASGGAGPRSWRPDSSGMTMSVRYGASGPSNLEADLEPLGIDARPGLLGDAVDGRRDLRITNATREVAADRGGGHAVAA